VAYAQVFETAADTGSPLVVKFPGSEAAAQIAALARAVSDAADERSRQAPAS
jgi:hypothetical protein